MSDENNTEKTRNEAKLGTEHLTRRDIRQTRIEMRAARLEMRRHQRAQRPPSYLFWGLMFILWAIIIFFYQRDWLAVSDIWKAFITGLGAIFIIQTIIFYLTTSLRPHVIGRLVPGLILVFIGLGFLMGFSAWWPVALAVTGVSVIIISWLLQREIERRRITQETLRESEVKYRHIIDNANSFIMEMEKGGNVTFINKFALDFFGYKETEILGHNIVGTIKATSPDSFVDHKKMIGDIATHPENYLHNESENLRRNGEKAWIIWTYKPIFDEANNLKEILCIGIDRTQQKMAEDMVARQLKEQTAVEERTRLARDLHDAVSQTLFSASLIADVLPRIWERNKDDGLKKLEEVRQLTRGALAEMRTLLFELRPAALSDADLNDLLRQLSESVTGRARVPVTLDVNGNCEVPPDVKVALYRIAQEALNNIAKHSGAGRAQVNLRCEPQHITLQITDDGHGFDISRASAGSFGLNNMKERAGQIKASLRIDSKIDEGTKITVDWNDDIAEVSP
jgi:PAS domain S-box-containing protein